MSALSRLGQPRIGGSSKPVISLKGSVKMVAKFFGYAIQNILYLREIYDEKSFMKVTEYGVNLHVTKDPALKDYLGKCLDQITAWLSSCQVKQVVMVIETVETKTPLERWLFNVEVDGRAQETGAAPEEASKSEEEIAGEIRALIKQITSATTFLPGSYPRAGFDVLAYTDKNTLIPSTWEVSDPRLIANPEACQLRSFSTSVHNIGAYVCWTRDAENLGV